MDLSINESTNDDALSPTLNKSKELNKTIINSTPTSLNVKTIQLDSDDDSITIVKATPVNSNKRKKKLFTFQKEK